MHRLTYRIDGQLHDRLKAVAKGEGRSVNSIVVESIEQTVKVYEAKETPMERKARMIAEGRVVVPPQPEGPVLTWEQLDELSRGWGPVVSEQLDRDRHEGF